MLPHPSDTVPSAVTDFLDLPQKTGGVVPVDTVPVETQTQIPTQIPSQTLSRFSLLTGRRSNRVKEDGVKEDRKVKEKQREKERDREKEKSREKEVEKVKEVEKEKKSIKEPSTERLSSLPASKIFPYLMKGAGSTVDLKKASGPEIPQVMVTRCALFTLYSLFFILYSLFFTPYFTVIVVQ